MAKILTPKVVKMKMSAKYLLSIIGLTSVLLFCVSAVGMASDPTDVGSFFSEPISMVFQGIALIGMGSIIKNGNSKQ
jgi:hypothetical protein